jgi:hypothetical protein
MMDPAHMKTRLQNVYEQKYIVKIRVVLVERQIGVSYIIAMCC